MKKIKSSVGILLMLGGVSTALAGTYNVAKWGSDSLDCGSRSSPCLTIQQAIDNSDGNDKIVVFPGTYTENIIILNDGTKLESVGGRYATIIETADGTGNTDIIVIFADKVQIGKKGKAFSLVGNGVGSGDGVIAYGDNHKIEDNIVTAVDRGIYFQGEKAQVRNNIVENNNDYGITCFSCSGSNIADNLVQNNQYGIDISGFTNGVSLTNNIVSGNAGSGIYFSNISHSNKIVANVAYENGDDGFYVGETDGSTITDNIATNNDDDGFDLDQDDDENKSPIVSSNSAISNGDNGFDFSDVLTETKFDKNSAIQNADRGVVVGDALSVGFSSFKNNNTYASGSGTGLDLDGVVDTTKPIKHFYGSTDGPDSVVDGDANDAETGAALIEGTFATKENKFASTKAAGL